MRALAEPELEEIERAGAYATALVLPGDPDAGVARDLSWPMLVARAALDPNQLRYGQHAPLWTPAEIADMGSGDVDQLLVAQRRAQQRAKPDLDEQQTRDAIAAIRQRAQNGLAMIRARKSGIAEYFGVPTCHHVTDWQAMYFLELTR